MSQNYSLSHNPKTNQYFYNRTHHFLGKQVINLLANCYHVDPTRISLLTSGINSLSIMLECIMIENNFNKINIIYSNELYCDTPRYIKYFDQVYGVSNISTFDVSKPNDLIENFNKELKSGVNILIMESCSNPNGFVFDFSVIPELRKLSKKLYVVVDNTWTTHVVFNPLEQGADIVFSSMSKHYSGGSCIGGFTISPSAFAKNLNNLIRMRGIHISIPYCQLFLKNIPKMEERIKMSFEKTMEMVNF